MLRRLVRALGTLGTAWTLAVLAAPTLLHPCPAHGAGHGAGHGAHADASAVPVDVHAGHAGHAAADGSATTTAAATSEPEPTPPCQCVDCCCTTAPVAVTIQAPTTLVATSTPPHRAIWPTAASAPARSRALRLPFANGPPALNS